MTKVRFKIIAGHLKTERGFTSFTYMPFSCTELTSAVFDVKAKDIQDAFDEFRLGATFQELVSRMIGELNAKPDADNTYELFVHLQRGERKFPGFDKITNDIRNAFKHKELSSYASF